MPKLLGVLTVGLQQKGKQQQGGRGTTSGSPRLNIDVSLPDCFEVHSVKIRSAKTRVKEEHITPRQPRLAIRIRRRRLRLMFRTMVLIAVMTPILIAATARGETLREKIEHDHPGLIPAEALNRAFSWFDEHRDKVLNKNYITIVDFTQPSTAKRCHVINLRTGEVESLLVAHARQSGLLHAEHFSNVDGSNKSSLGIYLTGELYQGKHGLSMKLDGMEPTNSNARKRAIVMHGADYVSEKTIASQKRLGRSLGCPALEMSVIERIVKQLNNRSVLLIYGKESTTPTTTESDSPKASPGIDE
jgi:hypothetical protein